MASASAIERNLPARVSQVFGDHRVPLGFAAMRPMLCTVRPKASRLAKSGSSGNSNTRIDPSVLFGELETDCWKESLLVVAGAGVLLSLLLDLVARGELTCF